MHISWRAFDNVSLSNNNLTATLPTHLQSTIATGNGVSSGKWYWEVLVQSTGAIVGITSTTASGQIWNTVNHRGYFSGAAKWGGTSGSSYGTTFSIGDVISILLDMDAGIIEFWKNGVTQGVAFTNVKSLGTVYPFYGNPTGTGIPSTATARFERKAFSYQVPDGYLHYDIKDKIFLSSGYKNYCLEYVVSRENAVPVMTSASNINAKVTASAYNASDYPWYAFDGIVNATARPFWYTNSTSPEGGHWLQVEFENPKVVSGISLVSLLITGSSYSIKEFELYGSNDGAVYEKLYMNTQPNGGTKIYYDFENTKAYSSYRLNILSSYHLVTTVGVSEMEIFQKNNEIMYVLDTSNEISFNKYGMKSNKSFNGAVDKIKDVIKTNFSLDSGKTFEHIIDMLKRRVDKITLG